jgi:hypothetical protein
MTANIAAIARDPGNRENQMSCGGDSNVASPVHCAADPTLVPAVERANKRLPPVLITAAHYPPQRAVTGGQEFRRNASGQKKAFLLTSWPPVTAL